MVLTLRPVIRARLTPTQPQDADSTSDAREEAWVPAAAAR
jgi:hypothetical protein